MGEMADMLLGDMLESYNTIFTHYRPVFAGNGPCPKCGSETRLIEGKFGKFYGCIKFPECHGNRNWVEL